MLHLTLLLEDCVLVADRNSPDDTGLWDVRLQDAYQGTFQRISLTDVQLAAMVGLGIGAEQDEPLIEALRGIDQPKELDRSLAPIPLPSSIDPIGQ